MKIGTPWRHFDMGNTPLPQQRTPVVISSVQKAMLSGFIVTFANTSAGVVYCERRWVKNESLEVDQ